MKYLNYLLGFILKNRRSGTTTLIKKIASENDCYVVVRFQQEIISEYNDIKDKCITLEQLFDTNGLPEKPILFETQAIKYICETSKNNLETLYKHNYKRDLALKKIKESIIEFELNGNKIGSALSD